MPRKRNLTAEQIGPRLPGGRYLSGYWLQEYTVLHVSSDSVFSWSMTVQWADGRTTTHATAWDARRDRVIPQPA